MNTYENREVKKYLAVTAVCALAAVLLIVWLAVQTTNQMRDKENLAIERLLVETLQQNPDTDVSKLIQVLNTTGEIEDGEREALLKTLYQYGIQENMYLIADMKGWQRQLIIGAAVFLCVAESGLVLLFCLYLRKRRQQIGQLCDYMEQISRGQYQLELAEISEDELSNLKNQLYKITVMLKEQAETARHHKEALAQSVSDISHQLKTPLTSASILLENLCENEEMPPDLRNKFIRETANQVQSMSWMIVSMLKLSRLDAGVVEFEQKEISVKEMVQEAVENLEVIAELKGVQVQVREMADTVRFLGDYNWNREALQNIVKNAIEHSKENEIVSVTVEDNNVYTAITVTNQGEPLSKEMQKQIFTRYYSASSDANHVGIGLPLAKAIVEKQNGYLTVESGQGKNSFVLKYRK